MAGSRTRARARKAALFINVTRGREDVHAVSMALSLACSALDEGHRVTVFLNVAAPIFASTELSEEVQLADFPPVGRMMRDIVNRGGKVLVCAHCAALAGVDRSKILPGVEVVQHRELLAALAPGMVGISY